MQYILATELSINIRNISTKKAGGFFVSFFGFWSFFAFCNFIDNFLHCQFYFFFLYFFPCNFMLFYLFFMRFYAILFAIFCGFMLFSFFSLPPGLESHFIIFANLYFYCLPFEIVQWPEWRISKANCADNCVILEWSFLSPV